MLGVERRACCRSVPRITSLDVTESLRGAGFREHWEGPSLCGFAGAGQRESHVSLRARGADVARRSGIRAAVFRHKRRGVVAAADGRDGAAAHGLRRAADGVGAARAAMQDIRRLGIAALSAHPARGSRPVERGIARTSEPDGSGSQYEDKLRTRVLGMSRCVAAVIVSSSRFRVIAHCSPPPERAFPATSLTRVLGIRLRGKFSHTRMRCSMRDRPRAFSARPGFPRSGAVPTSVP